MSTLTVILLCAAVVVVVVGLGYVVWRWGGKKAKLTEVALVATGGVLGAIKSFFKDDPNNLDAHDFLAAGEAVSNTLATVLKSYEAGKDFSSLREDMIAAVRQIANDFPSLKDALSDAVIAKEVDAALSAIANLPWFKVK